MKTAVWVLLLVLQLPAWSAVLSDILFPIHTHDFDGTVGNVVFHEGHFVAPVISSNGTLGLRWLDTNGAPQSAVSFSNTSGVFPRLAVGAPNLLLAWMDTNQSALFFAAVSNAQLLQPRLVATNVSSSEPVWARAQHELLLLWQSAGSPSAIHGRRLAPDGTPMAETIAVAPSPSNQRHVSADSDGTNFLVCWMEQSVGTNDWRVLGRRIVAGEPQGAVIPISETNSMRPYATACAFGTNYLVAWSADEGPWPCEPFDSRCNGDTNVWFPAGQVRLLSTAGEPINNSVPVLRGSQFNTNISVVFADGQYVVTGERVWWWRLAAQPVLATGEIRDHAFDFSYSHHVAGVRAYGASAPGRSCWVFVYSNCESRAVVLARQVQVPPPLFAPRRTNDGIHVYTGYTLAISTNLVDWQDLRATNSAGYQTAWYLSRFADHPQVFVRSRWVHLECMKNLRRIDHAKQELMFNRFLRTWDEPRWDDLFIERPVCPALGWYELGKFYQKPTCAIVGHTI
jgi:hypothetical protein